MARRGLSAEDRAIWARVADSVTPLRLARAAGDLPHQAPRPHPGIETAAVGPEPLPTFRIGERALPTAAISPVAAPLPRMDAGRFRRLSRGRLAPEARIDLHGLTLHEAHAALTGFVLRAHGRGLRLLLVITGKGRRAEGEAPFARVGALRQDVPRWLRLAPLAPLVLDVVEAHRRHGGEGAIYVYLRS